MKTEKTHWKKLTNPDYIGTYALPDGKDLTVKILSVSVKKVKGTAGKTQECIVAELENNKPLILNKTNMKIITKIYNTPFIEEWAGKTIILFSELVDAFGEKVEGLRIRPIIPANKKNNEIAIDKIQNCKTLADLKTVFTSLNKEEQMACYTLKEKLKTILK